MTDDFLDAARAWQREFIHHEHALRQVMGDEWDERVADRAELIRGVEQRLLRRVLVRGTASIS